MMLQLVDEMGSTIGYAPKIESHANGGLLHRAVSVVLLNDESRILIQRRAAGKYHFAEKWANAACSHPCDSETPLEAGRRALRHELGIETDLQEVTRFIYSADDPVSGLFEKEYDHVLLGSWVGDIDPNPHEVAEVEWVTASVLMNRMTANKHEFAYWFRRIISELMRLCATGALMPIELRTFVLGLSDSCHRELPFSIDFDT